MPASVVVYRIHAHHRSDVVCTAMVKGLRKQGVQVLEKYEHEYRHRPEAYAAVFYGLEGNLREIFKHYQRPEHRAVYIDLGYWGRRQGGRWAGYHKIVVNSRHPTAYFQTKQHSPGRFRQFGLHPKPWKSGRFILLAGMGAKGAWAENLGQEEWERTTLDKLKSFTDRPIIYRPKPSWKHAQPIPGTIYSPKIQPLEDVLKDCHAVVSHHSNVSVDALMEGIPAFTWDGVARCMSGQDLANIESPHQPEGRQQWAENIAWTQWNIDEMATGKPWLHLKSEGLV